MESLRKEHTKLLKMLLLLERLLQGDFSDLKSYSALVKRFTAFQRAFILHTRREELQVYNVIQDYTEAGQELAKIMREDHDRVLEAIDRGLLFLDGGKDVSLSVSNLRLAFKEIYSPLVDHFTKEDKVVFWYLEVALSKDRISTTHAKDGE